MIHCSDLGGLLSISFIEHPVRSITKSSSLIKCSSEDEKIKLELTAYQILPKQKK